MKKNSLKTKLSLDLQSSESSRGSEFPARLPSFYSQPTLAIEGGEKFSQIYSTDVNLTIRLKVTEITRKQVTILAGQALYKVLNEGLTLGDWMTLEFLYSYLLGSKLEPLKLNNSKEIELALLLKVVLLSGTWIGLEEKTKLPIDIQILLESSKWVPNKRTYQSRKNLFSFSRYLQVRIVPIDNLIDRSRGTLRYSSYCKGYGESSRMGRRQKTRPSSELDGEPVDLEKETLIKVPLQQIGQILQIVLLETKYSLQKK